MWASMVSSRRMLRNDAEQDNGFLVRDLSRDLC